MRVVVAALSICLVATSPVRADDEPTSISDGVYVGARIDPGVALLAGWDLDVYLRDDRAWSIGPGVFVAVLGVGERAGMDQELFVAVDALRFEMQMSEAGGRWRPFVVIGGGASYARLRAQGEAPDRFEAAEKITALATIGGGADLFTGGPWALSTLVQARVHLWGSGRLPVVWLELATGVRFGL